MTGREWSFGLGPFPFSLTLSPAVSSVLLHLCSSEAWRLSLMNASAAPLSVSTFWSARFKLWRVKCSKVHAAGTQELCDGAACLRHDWALKHFLFLRPVKTKRLLQLLDQHREPAWFLRLLEHIPCCVSWPSLNSTNCSSKHLDSWNAPCLLAFF